MHERHLSRPLMAMLLGGALLACGGGGDVGADGADAASPTSAAVPLSSGPPPTPTDATVPTDCAEVGTDALAEAWGAEPILDTEDSHYEEPIEELRCEWYSDAQATKQITLQLSIQSNYIGYYASQEATSAGDFTAIDGFDDGRLYGDGLMLGQRNGFVVAVDAGGASITDEQMIAIASDATPSP